MVARDSLGALRNPARLARARPARARPPEGAVVYAIKRPDPVPAVFGYHEIFHALVIVAAALQYAVIAFWIVLD